MLDPANAFYGLVLKNVASESIYGIRGIDDNTPVVKAFDNRFDLPLLRMFRMYVEPHDLKVRH
jgi:hypothetical protein